MLTYTIITSFLIALFSFLSGRQLLKKKNIEDKYFAWFWLFVGCMWLIGASRPIFNKLEIYQVSEIMPHIVQIILAIHTIPFALLIIHRLTKNITITKFAGLFAAIFGISYIYYILSDGLSATIHTVYGPDNIIPVSATFIFQMMFFFSLPLFIFDFLSSLIKMFSKFTQQNIHYFLVVLSLIIYAFGGFFDKIKIEVGQDWHLFLLRIIYLVSALIAYTYATSRTKNQDYAKK